MSDADPHVGDVVTPPLYPPGTEREGFWRRSVTQGAIVSTIGLGLMVLRGYIVGIPPSPEALAVAIEAVVWAWAGAVGVATIGAPSIRRA